MPATGWPPGFAITGRARAAASRSSDKKETILSYLVRVRSAPVIRDPRDPREILERIYKALEHENRQLRTQLAKGASAHLEDQARTVDGARVLAAQADRMDRQQLRELADALRNKWKSAVVVLASVEDSSISIVSAVTKDLTAKVHAGKLAASLAQAVGGKGGGRPDMAEGAGKDPAALAAALERIYAEVESKL